MAVISEQEFSRHLNTKFRVKVEAPRPIELELEEIKSYQRLQSENDKLERFSLYFRGPGDLLLPQHLYPLEHDSLGSVELFLVPIGNDERGLRYEAVFNQYV
jgi:hypothetical protein